jgi:hypothetical protein
MDDAAFTSEFETAPARSGAACCGEGEEDREPSLGDAGVSDDGRGTAGMDAEMMKKDARTCGGLCDVGAGDEFEIEIIGDFGFPSFRFVPLARIDDTAQNFFAVERARWFPAHGGDEAATIEKEKLAVFFVLLANLEKDAFVHLSAKAESLGNFVEPVHNFNLVGFLEVVADLSDVRIALTSEVPIRQVAVNLEVFLVGKFDVFLEIALPIILGVSDIGKVADRDETAKDASIDMRSGL